MRIGHIVDCKGVVSIVGGNVLQTLLRIQDIENNKDVRLAFLNKRKYEFYSDCNVPYRFGEIKLDNLSGGDGGGKTFACLEVPIIKQRILKF